ncbi:MAG: twin-arginine translocase TatA/TatE family subunit [Terriglobia bacterium]|jgi:sec-independent protein translocase protein TatA|nr:twin-arginine translocase TatA/TatE family subunit [Terriglobia bacterium]
MGDIGIPELLLIFGIALLIFGPRKIGELGKGLGEGIRHFKAGLREPSEEPAAPVASAPIAAPTPDEKH